MEQEFSYTRDNIPPAPPITKEMKPQIPYNYPLPFQGPEPQKMSAVEPELRFDSPEEWWNVPRGNFPGESLPKTPPESQEELAPLFREAYQAPKTSVRPNLKVTIGILLLLIVSFILINN